jgi:hypothetical protein
MRATTKQEKLPSPRLISRTTKPLRSGLEQKRGTFTKPIATTEQVPNQGSTNTTFIAVTPVQSWVCTSTPWLDLWISRICSLPAVQTGLSSYGGQKVWRNPPQARTLLHLCTALTRRMIMCMMLNGIRIILLFSVAWMGVGDLIYGILMLTPK